MKEIFEQYRKQHILQCMDIAFNRIPAEEWTKANHDKERLSMQLKEDKKVIPIAKESIPLEHVNQGAEKVFTLPISFEDSSTLTGSAELLKSFADHLQIPLKEDVKYLPFNEKDIWFELEDARRKYVFEQELAFHQAHGPSHDASSSSDESDTEDGVEEEQKKDQDI